MMGPGVPGWVGHILTRTLPAEYRHELQRDLAGAARRRFGTPTGGARVQLWYIRQLLSPTMLLLIWKLRRRGDPMTGGSMLTDLGRQLRHGTRSLARSPMFTAAAVAALALGIGANTAIFSVVNAVLVRPPPYEEPDDLAFIWNRLSGFELDRLPLAGVQVMELRGEEAVFDDVGGIWATTLTMSVEGRAVLASSGLVTPNFFSVLGVQPSLGRTFGEDEGTGTGPTVIVSHGFWTQELGADPDAVGRSVQLEGGSAVVIGVLPPDFKLVFPPAVGIPERLDVYRVFPWEAASYPQGSRFLRTVARLRPGVSMETAHETVRSVADRLRGTYEHMAEAGDDFFAVPLRADAVRSIRSILLVLVGGVAVFLLLTAVNVASLLLSRATTRQRELALRTCLGASRRELVGLSMVEIALLVTAGTALGLALGGWGANALWALRPDGIARVDELGLDPLVLGFTVAAAALAATVAGLAPVTRLRRSEPMLLLRAAGSSSDSVRARQVITVAEVALSVVLVIGSGLVAQTLVRMESAQLGFEPERVLTFRVGLSQRQFPTDGERAALAQEIEDELVQLPAVLSAGGGSHIPLADWANWSGTAAPEGTPDSELGRFHFDHRSVTPRYLATLGAELVSGRHFQASDLGGSEPVVVVDEALVARAFAGSDPVGRRVIATRYVGGEFEPTAAVVVGVIRNLRDHSPTRESQGQVYWPFAQSARWELTYAVRTGGEPTSLIERVRGLVTAIHPDLGVADVRTLDAYVRESMGETRFTSLLGAVFSTLALALAGLGMYGVMSYSALRRTRELGVRLALGARSEDLFRGVLREGLLLGGVGVLLGLIGAGVMTRYLEAVLYEVDPLEPLVFGGVAVVLLSVAIMASAGPALRTSRLDPVRSLQVE